MKKLKKEDLQIQFTLGEVILALKNSGINTECGACMEVAFTGSSPNEHSCGGDLP